MQTQLRSLWPSDLSEALLHFTDFPLLQQGYQFKICDPSDDQLEKNMGNETLFTRPAKPTINLGMTLTEDCPKPFGGFLITLSKNVEVKG